MIDILIDEAIPNSPTWSHTRESDEGNFVGAPQDEWTWQHLASRQLPFDLAHLILRDSRSIDSFEMPLYGGSLASLVLPDELSGQFRSADYLLAIGDVFNAMRDIHMEQIERVHFPVVGNSTTPPDELGVHRLFACTFETHSNTRNPLLLPVRDFALGVGGVQPNHIVVEMAARIVQAIHEFAIGPHVTIDDEGGRVGHSLEAR